MSYLYQKPSSGAGPEESVPASPHVKVLNDWAPDGRFLLYHAVDPKTGPDIWMLSLEGDRKTSVFLKCGTLMATPIRVNGTTLDVGTPAALFLPPIVGGGTNIIRRRPQYDAASDGRFLISVIVEEAVMPPITVVLNWKPKP